MLTVSNVSKSFPGAKALSGVQLEVKAGEIHALVGENGAGKSTLTKIIAGVFHPGEGQIEFDGEIIHWNSPADAKAAGIHVIYQEFVLFPNLTVAENISSAMSVGVPLACSIIAKNAGMRLNC